jgi:uncharacterized metal-binding protein
MSSGRTHDRITLISLPILTGISLLLTRNAELTLWVAGSFLFGGLMFGPDLDIHSNQSIRWGWFRWMWQPYRQAVPHRSALSHGPIIGTVCRLLYVGLWAILLALLYQSACYFLKWPMWNEVRTWRAIQQFVTKHYTILLSIFVGLEVGSMSHYSADFLSSLSKKIFAEKKQPIDNPEETIETQPKPRNSKKSRQRRRT